MSASPSAQSSPFLERLILFLMPYFLTVTQDLDAARAEIIETIASYGTRTRAEMINAVQIIAFSFSALDVLAEAKATPEMSPSQRLRFRGCANNLNRSAQQNEDTLAARLAADVPDMPDLTAEPVNDISEAAFEESLRHAQAQIAAYRTGLSVASPIPAAQSDQMRLPDEAMINAIAPRGTPPRPASAA